LSGHNTPPWSNLFLHAGLIKILPLPIDDFKGPD